jgi:hypothetical protein
MEAEAACKKDGCVLVGENPTVSCMPLEAFEQFRPVFVSSSPVVGSGYVERKAVQVYEFTDAAR